MKYIKIALFSTAFLFTGLAFTSCGSSSTNTKDSKEYTSAYICPMHCKDSGDSKAGTCPVCKMDYVKNKKHRDHVEPESDHDGHNHNH